MTAPSATKLAPALELIGVAKEFHRPGRPPFLAVTEVTARVDDVDGRGEFVCIVGPSGCGKSTVLQLIAGFDTHLPPTKGEIRFLGERVEGPGRERGMLFQQYSCYPHLSVLDNVGFGLSLHARELGLSRREVREQSMAWIRKVRLSEKDAGKYPHELSGGMRQRAALARSLILKPRCLLMDEPFSALDEPTRYEMQDLIVELWTDIDATIVLVSHSIQEAVYLGDRVWVMSSAPGTIVAEFADVPLPLPDVPAMVAQSRPEFAQATHDVSRAFFRMLGTPREELKPVAAHGVGRSGLVGGDG